MSSQVDAKRSMRGATMAARINVECHRGMIPESDLPRYGIKPEAPIATFIKRLTCRACGGHSVRAFRCDHEFAPEGENPLLL
jgi:hypothetical protein